MQDPASALVQASTQLLEGLAASRQPLSLVSSSLAALACDLGVTRAMVAIDDAVYGRQVFCSGRSLLGDAGDLLWGPPRVRTDPPCAFTDDVGRLIVAAVAAAFERARSAPAPVARREDLVNGLGAATERSARYGWGFTLVLARFDHADERAPRHVEAHLRGSDTVVEIGARELGILLPAAAGDEVPGILARAGRGGAIPTFCYGLAACPGDASEPGALLALAAARLREADTARRVPDAEGQVV